MKKNKRAPLVTPARGELIHSARWSGYWYGLKDHEGDNSQDPMDHAPDDVGDGHPWDFEQRLAWCQGFVEGMKARSRGAGS